MRRLPPLAAIRAFEAAARTENFTAAAAELGMTQAAVSYQVKSLEARLGSPLFVRETRGAGSYLRAMEAGGRVRRRRPWRPLGTAPVRPGTVPMPRGKGGSGQ